jgi:hypothetical protein
MSKKVNLKDEATNGTKPVLCAGYSTAHFLEIKEKFNNLNGYDKFKFISRCSGIELIIKDKRYWFEFFGKQITITDIYIPNSSFARMLHSACT